MSLIIRIDVDNPFHWYKFHMKALNYVALNWTKMLNKTRLGYLKCARHLLTELIKHDVLATWFFTLWTLPDKDLLEEIKDAGHELAFHAVRTDTWRLFNQDLETINHYYTEPVMGFSKHGSGDRKLSKAHTPEYNLSKLLGYAKRSHLHYFIGNGENPNNDVRLVDSIIFFPDCYWANPEFRDNTQFNFDWLVKSTEESTKVFLIHPSNWYFVQKIQEMMTNIFKSDFNYILPSKLKLSDLKH